MADDNAKLLIVLEAQSKKLQSQLVDATRTIDRFAAQTNRRFDQMNTKNAASFETLNKRVGVSMGTLNGIIGKAFAGAAALRGAQVLIDASIRIENSLKVAGLSGEELDGVYQRLFASAQKNAAPVEALVDLYGKLALVQKELGISGLELEGFVDNIAVALRVSGKSAAESSGALLQLSQALGGGVVRAEEFSSMLEGALPIVQAVAAGLTEAGGSVAKLRQLVVDGKVSSEAFFRAFEAGSVILTDKVANAELTVSQGFIRLQNVLIDAAGKFDAATGASQELGQNLSQIADLIALVGNAFADNQGAIQQFIDVIDGTWSREAGESIRANIIDTINDIRMGPLIDETNNMQMALDDALMSLDDWRAGWSEELPPQLFASVDGLIEKLIAGGDEAKIARAALEGLGAVNPDFEQAFTSLGNLAGELQRVRGEAVATAAAVAGANAPPQSYAGQDGVGKITLAVKPVSIADYAPPTAPAKGSGRSGGGSKQSPGEKFEDVLKKQAEENRLLQEKTTLQATLNPLIEDYGFALEKLNVEQELLSAATKAGIELTPALKTQINDLATGYANASVEAKKLAESQEQVKQIAADFGEAGSSAIKGFISDLREGKSGAEALSNALNSVLDKVIDIGLNMLLGGGGGGLFAGIGKLFGFASGGYTGDGGKNQPAGVVHKGEYVFTKAQTERLGVSNLSRLAKGYASGGYVGAPGPITAQGGNSGGAIAVSVSIDVQNGNLVPTITQVAGQVAGQQIKSNNKQLPNLMADYNMRQG